MDTSVKCCTKCGDQHPNTLEYFRLRDGKTGSWCRQCCRASGLRYRTNNPDKRQQSTRQWRISHAEQKHESDVRYRNTEQPRKSQQRYRQNHPNRERERHHNYRLNNPEKQRESERKWRRNNPEKLRNKDERRRAKQHSQPYSFTEKDWLRALHYFCGCCVYCGNPPSLFDVHRILHQEHHIPVEPDYILAEPNPGYVPTNILPACQSCNLSKGNNNPEEWIVKRFGKRKARLILKNIQTYFEHLNHL